MRRKTRTVMVGKVGIGGNSPISIQSMTNISIDQVDRNVTQIVELYECGCELIRLAVPKASDVYFFKKIKEKVRNLGFDIPLIADVHFSPRIAYDCLNVADKVRINAGNFGESSNRLTRDAIIDKFVHFFESAKKFGVPVRIGINAGSLSDRILSMFGNTAQGMWESAYECLLAAQKINFHDLVLSFKASNVGLMVAAYRLACSEMDHLGMNYPLHLGITEAGDHQYARVKSSIGIGSLLLDGIGDTIRVSLTEDPKNEIIVARDILQSVNARRFSPEFIACPSCGRTSYDIQSVLQEVKNVLTDCDRCLKIAVMGCIVNGLGESSDADYAIIGMPNGQVAIYKQKTCVMSNIVPEMAPTVLKKIISSD